MHIGFRTSGGRGEYEVVGSQSGYRAADLEGWSFFMLWPDGRVRDTGLWLDSGESGKPRLRSKWSPPIQIGKIVASMLLLPDPKRDVKSTASNYPIPVAQNYSVTQVGFGVESEFSGIVDRVTFVPAWIEVSSSSDSDVIGVTERWSRIESVYSRIDSLPESVRAPLSQHRSYLNTGRPVDLSLTTIVKSLSKVLEDSLNGDYVAGTDPLPALERYVGASRSDGPVLPPPNQLSGEEPEINARSAHQYRLAKARGPEGRRFSKEVRTAYRNRCAFCGARLGGIEGIRSGIDAAHILAWSKHDLDIVPNGIALCKLHHWAFDSGVLLLEKVSSNYYMRLTSLSQRLDVLSIDRIGADRERIPEEWLPEDPDLRPSAHYLNLLYADLGVEFID